MTEALDAPADAFLSRGIAHLFAGRAAEAAADLTAALCHDPELADAYHHRAGARLAVWDLPAALADADAAVNRAPGRANFWLTRANVRYHLGDVAAAWVDYRSAFALDLAGTARLVVDTAVRDATGQWRAAVRDCGDHLRADPADFISLARRGLVLLLRGRDAEAAADFDEYRRLNPGGAAQLAACIADAGRRGSPPAVPHV